MVDLLGVDLNLLVSLDALLEECNVTKAAERLRISQPALSAQLTRLRTLFEDPLLIPAETGRGMTPTARALELAKSLHEALKGVEAVVKLKPVFDPMQAERTFTIAASDYAIVVVGLPLLEKLRKIAGPRIRVSFRMPDPSGIAEPMTRGEIDLLIGIERMVPLMMKAKKLLTERFVLAQRKGHPRGTGPVDVDTYCSLQHVLVSTSSDSFHGFIDDYLAGLGRSRNVIVALQQYITAPALLSTTDYVCTLPRELVARFPDQLDAFELPFVEEGFTLYMAWHPRVHRDPASEWLRGALERQ